MPESQVATGLLILIGALVAALFGCCWILGRTFHRTCLTLASLQHRALEGLNTVVQQAEQGRERADGRLSAITTELLASRSLVETGSLQHAAHILSHSTNDKRMDQPLAPEPPPPVVTGPHVSPDIEIGGDVRGGLEGLEGIVGPGGPEA
jgi:hypothetical protein